MFKIYYKKWSFCRLHQPSKLSAASPVTAPDFNCEERCSIMANASLCEFDISPLRLTRPETLRLQWTERKDALNSLSIQPRSHHYSVPVWKRWRTLLEPAMIWTAVVTRSRLPPHFNPVYIHTWKLDLTSCIRCLGSVWGSSQCLYSNLRYLRDLYTTAHPFYRKLAKLWSFTVTEETPSCFVFWQQKI